MGSLFFIAVSNVFFIFPSLHQLTHPRKIGRFQPSLLLVQFYVFGCFTTHVSGAWASDRLELEL